MDAPTCMTGCADAGRSGFVYLDEFMPEAILDVRYYSAYNFIGDRIRGYERPTLLLAMEAAVALKAVSDEMIPQGFRLKLYDAYRPQRAVDHFVEWSKIADDTRMKRDFYPDLDKSMLFPRGYIAARSGHTRGSTVDLTLVESESEKDVDMGGTFDWFGPKSHFDWCGDPETRKYTGGFPDNTPPAGRSINEVQFRNRMMLRTVMMKHRFVPVMEEWWHFTLADEPYPDTYFDFPVR
ncbi:MAG: M15 family metallopeptidase [Clostridia bacterium]|nr:M15 family metallopeptidase [Clostridia bacterium]